MIKLLYPIVSTEITFENRIDVTQNNILTTHFLFETNVYDYAAQLYDQ